MNYKRIAIAGGIAVAVAVGAVGIAYAATPKPSVGLDSAGVIHECISTSAPYTVTANVKGAATDTCPSGYTQLHFLAGAGKTGATGPKGATGATGATGAAGAAGATGPAGPAGVDGKDGKDAAAATYGIALVNVSRGGKAATTWGTYSTAIGSPVGDTTSGTFRMACSAANAPCVISVQAYATVAGVKVYPRLDISRDDTNNVATGNCEYADGTDNNGGTSAELSHDSASPTDVKLGIGGTLDCGSSQTYPTNGVASEIDVPAGFYDIAFTGTFTK